MPDMEPVFDTKKIEHKVRQGFSGGLFHGIVVSAGKAESLNFLRAWGYASVKPKKRKMQIHSVFDVASITKAVAVSSACGICIDRGLLDPDAPAEKYLPQIGQLKGSVIRVRDLATHCSGFDNRKFDSFSREQLFERAIESPPQWPAGRRFEYSCRNYIILGAIIENITGKNLGEFCRLNVFEPLGMEDTVFGPIHKNFEHVVPTEQPAGIISDRQARVAGRPIGNAGLFSSAGDLALFCRMLLNAGKKNNKRILGDEALKWITRPCSPPGLTRRSFGWDMSQRSESPHRPTDFSQDAFGHSGWTGQSIWIDPEQGLYVIVLTNRTHFQGNVDNYEASKLFRGSVADILVEQIRGQQYN